MNMVSKEDIKTAYREQVKDDAQNVVGKRVVWQQYNSNMDKEDTEGCRRFCHKIAHPRRNIDG